MTSDTPTARLDILDKMFGETSAVFYTAAAEGDFDLNYVSRNIGRVLGVLPETCIGTVGFWRARIDAEDAVHVLGELAGLAAGICCYQEFRFRDDQNNFRWVSNEVTFKRDAGDDSGYLAGCLHDISAAKKYAAEFSNHLKEQSAREHFYLSVLDSLPQRLFWKDRNSVFRGCNLNGAHALNLAQTGEIVGKSDYDFYANHEEADYLRLHDEQVMNSGEASYHTEVSARESDTWLDVTKVPLRDEGGDIYGLLISYEDVSALKKSEMTLHKFKRAVEQSSNSIVITDVDGSIEYVNPAFQNTYGYEEHEVLGQNPRLLKSGLMPQSIYPEIWEAILSGRSWRGELSNRSKSGVISWQLTFISPIFDEHGMISHFLAIGDDVTGRRKIEDALTESEARLHEVTNSIGEGIFVINTEGDITFVNPTAAKLLGQSVKNLLGISCRNIFNDPRSSIRTENDTRPPAYLAKNIGDRWLANILHQHKALRSDNEFFKHQDGSRFQVSYIATPIFRNEQFAGAVVAFHDITEQKFTQKLLDDTLLELRTILDNAQIGVAYLRQNEFSWINKHMEQMFGYTVGELIGKPMEAIYANDENLQNSSGGEMHDLLTKGVVENERPMKKSTGEVFWCHQRGIAIDSEYPDKGSIWIMLDIDRLKNTENHLKALNETLASRVDDETRKSLEKERLLIQQGRTAAMGEMIGNIAHQWRQPLSTLGLVVQNIHADYQEKTLDDSSLEKYVATAKQAIQRMSCTIDDFRDFFRPNRVRECFSICQSIHETMQLLDAMMKNNGIAVRLTGDQKLKTLGHPNEFSQVILNFITNAKDALVERKVSQGRIDIELTAHDKWGIVYIRDNAGGMKNDVMEKIFDPYFTTKPNGTGIGLYITKIIVENHMGGSITCRNTAEGAEFIITIPLGSDCVISEYSEGENDCH
ncbi:MAG: PAS domain S-box protein [Gallionella sp.]|nr:PAS domain S-box protein [Gallionella sp.]